MGASKISDLKYCDLCLCLLDLERKEQELEQLRMDCEHFRARLETVQADSVREKKVRSGARRLLPGTPASWPWPRRGSGSLLSL